MFNRDSAFRKSVNEKRKNKNKSSPNLAEATAAAAPMAPASAAAMIVAEKHFNYNDRSAAAVATTLPRPGQYPAPSAAPAQRPAGAAAPSGVTRSNSFDSTSARFHPITNNSSADNDNRSYQDNRYGNNTTVLPKQQIKITKKK